MARHKVYALKIINNENMQKQEEESKGGESDKDENNSSYQSEESSINAKSEDDVCCNDIVGYFEFKPMINKIELAIETELEVIRGLTSY